MNALAHCAEALYVAGRNPDGDRARAGRRAADRHARCPRCWTNGDDLEARTDLLEGAMESGAALGSAGLGLGHAMAQALGGRYGIAHGAANALTLPPALRFNQPVAAAEIARFGEALGTDDPARRAEELARLSRLRAATRPGRARGRARRGRRGDGHASRREGESASRERGGDRGAAARDLVAQQGPEAAVPPGPARWDTACPSRSAGNTTPRRPGRAVTPNPATDAPA